jgi:dynactin-4
MAQAFPYTYYACACYDVNDGGDGDGDGDERTFDPRNPRADFALHPLEQLLYCDDCQQMRCPRCVADETLSWFCPNCLFEVPSSVVKSDGPRCTRNCFNCPVCIAPLAVSSLELPDAPSPSPHGGPYILSCSYCHWSTLETGITLDKHTGVHAQLARIANGGRPLPTPKERDKERDRRLEQHEQQHDRLDRLVSPTTDAADAAHTPSPSRDDLFASLSAFYKNQLDAHTPANPFAAHDLTFSSPSTYSRILNLYSSTGSKKQKHHKPAPMREAASDLEGLQLHDQAADMAAIERIKKNGWPAAVSPAQRLAQPDPTVRFDDQLRPVATLLCTKRSKRCRSCRHILSKPESKITSTRYKIKLLALNHIPRLSIRALPPTSQAQTGTTSLSLSSLPHPRFNYNALTPGLPTHFLLHLSNPLFDPIRVTLATPSTTPGKVQSRITILCPQFEVGANTDVWDDALTSSSMTLPDRGSVMNADGQIEAGKPWDRGRNWTSIVIEVIPGFLDEVELDEDDNVLEIPIFVRLEFEADANVDENGLGDSRGSKAEKEKREDAFWTVLGAGRIAPV